jgi:hypothetical protein
MLAQLAQPKIKFIVNPKVNTMSKNHPNDNIYSILGKLEALKPTQEEKRFALVKEIRESVEAQGSILSGVDAVQAKLSQQFAEAKKSKPDFLDLDKDGDKKEPMKKAEKEKIEEKAVSQAQQKFMGMVHAAQKPGGKAASPEVARVAKDMGKKDAKDFASTKHKGLPAHVETECAMCEAGTCNDHMNEAEITRKAGVTTHRKTDFPGYPTDDTDDIEDTNKGQRGRPRKHAKKEPTGLGRGRPKKAAAVGSTAPKMHDPFGRVAPTAAKLKGNRGAVHSMDEAMDLLGKQLNALNEGRYLEDATGESLNHILNRFRAEVRNFEQGGDLDRDLYDALYDYYVECGEMPYGVQKARDADPMNWVAERLDVELGNHAYGSDPANAEGYGIEDEGAEGGIGHDLVTPQQRVAQATPPKPGMMGAIKDVAQGAKNWIQGKPEQGATYETVDPLASELNELAKLAGLKVADEGNAFTGKLKSTPNGGKFDLDGKEYTDTSTLDEEPNEGNEFSGELAKAKSNHADSFNVDGKEYPVKEADAPVDEPVDGELENTPKPKYGTIKQITSQGDDLNRQKKQDPHTANKASNPLTNVATLESRLAAEYESIKKASK